jgi:hypothetical protein
MGFFKRVLIFWSALVSMLWFSPSAWAGGAYHLEVTKGADEPALVTLDPLGSQAQETAGDTRTPYAGIRPSHHWDSSVGDGSLFQLLWEIFTLVGDYGIVTGSGVWQAPWPTRLTAPFEVWNSRPVLQTVQIGTTVNIQAFPFLELEPFLGMHWGEWMRSAKIDSNLFQEKLTFNEFDYGINFISPCFRPFFLEIGVCGATLTTTTEIQTELPAFTYSGFVLDHAATTQLSFGGGLVAPEKWPVRLRGGLIGFWQFADFGDSWGLRAYVTFMFTHKKLEYENY